MDDFYFEINEEDKEKLKKYYWKVFFNENFSRINYNDYIYCYDLVFLQRYFKVFGTFSFLFLEKGKKEYLKHIPKALDKFKKVLKKYKEYSKIDEAFKGYFYNG